MADAGVQLRFLSCSRLLDTSGELPAELGKEDHGSQDGNQVGSDSSLRMTPLLSGRTVQAKAVEVLLGPGDHPGRHPTSGEAHVARRCLAARRARIVASRLMTKWNQIR